MNLTSFTRATLIALSSAGLAAAQNDECVGAVALTLGVGTAFDTTTATLSPEMWPCAAVTTAPDLWYSVTATGNDRLRVETCVGTAYDSALEVFTGTCGALTSLACNDDACALQSALEWSATSGVTYLVRVGGFAAASGAGILTASIVPGPPTNCVVTLYAGANGGSVGGAVYFTMTVNQNVTLSGLDTNYDVAVGSPVGVTMYTTPTTHAGNETNMAAWTQVAVDNGAATSMGFNLPTPITFATPVVLAAGSYGIALVSAGDGHRYTNGNGLNQVAVSPDGVISLALGTATNIPFTGNVFTPRVWNGGLCHSGPVTPGTNYCGPAVPNSTLASGTISGTGTNIVLNNDLGLTADNLPTNAFGFFLTSLSQGFVPQPGGSLGVLCLGGQIGRYVGPGQIQNSGGAGSFSLALDLTQTPTPMGFVSVAAGETWNYQAWHRDSVGGVAVSNFTDGLSVTFQ